MSKYIIGLTGGIGSGKTTIANYFAELGITVVDADVIARDIVKKESPALASIAAYFGHSVIDENGELNRAELRARVFSNNDHKQWLNHLLHPLIRQEMVLQTQAASSPYCLLVVPLLIENNLMPLVDRILVIDVDTDTQLLRASMRDNNSKLQIQKIIDSQISRQERIAHADDIIDNQYQNTDEIQQSIVKLHNQYLRYANGLSITTKNV